MITPTLNLNGSSADDLIVPRLEAVNLIADAMGMLRKVTPHGRDYPANPQKCVEDREEHLLILQALQDIKDTIHADALAIHRQRP